ncbi:MAG: hypothetical protein RR452_01375, partial [Clostridia bacterium]
PAKAIPYAPDFAGWRGRKCKSRRVRDLFSGALGEEALYTNLCEIGYALPASLVNGAVLAQA